MLALVVNQSGIPKDGPVQARSLKIRIDDAASRFLHIYGVFPRVLELPENVIERVDFGDDITDDGTGELVFDEYFDYAVEITDDNMIILKR